MFLTPFILSLASACTPGSIIEDPPPSCDSGYLLDGSDCVPESCGAGRWGNLPVVSDTVYVDASSEAGGDGTEANPFSTIQRGLDRAGALGGGLVAVAAGIYPETLTLGSEHADVHLAGRCRDSVFLDASVGDERTPGIGIDAGDATVEVSGVTVRDSTYIGFVVGSGDVALRDATIRGSAQAGVGAYLSVSGGLSRLSTEACLIDGNTMASVFVINDGTEVTLRDTHVRNTKPDANGQYGRGIEVEDGATLIAEGCHIVGNTEAGVFAKDAGTRIDLLETTVADTHPVASGDGGMGVGVYDGATLSAQGSIIEGNSLVGLFATRSGTRVVLRDTSILNTNADGNGEGGQGITVEDGATLAAEGCLVAGNTHIGILATNPGTGLTLRDTSVRDTQSSADGETGEGISVQDGAILLAEGCIIQGNREIGLQVHGVGSGATLIDTTVKDTRTNANGSFGQGVAVVSGATLTADGCLVDGNTEIGLMATDPGTRITLRETSVRDTSPNANGWLGRGVEIDDGATLVAEACHITGNADVGLFTSKDTRVVLRDTTVMDTLPDAHEEFGRGIVAQDGAALSVQDCLIGGNTDVGLFATGSGTVVSLWDSTVQDTRLSLDGYRGRGIEVNDGAVFDAEGCVVAGNAGLGVLVGSAGTRASLRDTIVRDTRPDANGEYGRGIEVSKGGTILAEACLIEDNTEIGFFAADLDTRAYLRDTTIRGTKPQEDGLFGRGIVANFGAILSADGCLVDGNTDCGIFADAPSTQVTLRDTTVSHTKPDPFGAFGRGISVQSGAILSADGCLVDGNTGVGVYAGSQDTRVTLRDSTITGTRIGADKEASTAAGIMAQMGATLFASRVILGANEGPGIIVNSDAHLDCAACTVQDNQFAGAVAILGGDLSISDSTIEGTTPGINLLGGAGVYAWPWTEGDSPSVIVTNTLIRDNPVAGVWLIGDGTYVLTGNTISGGVGEPFGSGYRCGDALLARQGVTAWNGSSGLLLQDNVFQDASGAGIFLDGSAAMMSGDTFSGNTMDLVVQEQSCDTIPDSYAEAPRRDICPIYSYPTCFAEFFWVAMPAAPVKE